MQEKKENLKNQKNQKNSSKTHQKAVRAIKSKKVYQPIDFNSRLSESDLEHVSLQDEKDVYDSLTDWYRPTNYFD